MTDFSRHAIEKVLSKKGPVVSRTRKALQVLQVSARDQNVLVSSPSGIMPKNDKALESPKQILLRRSKRNVGKQENCPSKEEQPSNSKISKVASKSKKSSKVKASKKNVKKAKNEELILPHQSSLDSYISIGSKSSEINSVTVFKSSETYIAPVSESPEKNIATVSSENVFGKAKSDTFGVGEPAMCVTNNASDATFNVYTDWKKVAEQHRSDLEVLIHENAGLKDELEVIEADNDQLKSLLEEAEKVAEIVKAALV